ncbi:helix-turn-helix domain-containing protein [Microbulbifer sp. 2304DJ12-6]|uniref:helix-turn-helix domain-containing protein n=1 Tax=Microbulbifer sp. 2304DJ12-6 TaxID=3233340 RepID=UPI0039B07FD8
MNAIQIAVRAKRTQAKLAQSLGVTQGLVSAWVTGRKKIAPHWCLPIEQSTNGVITRYDLRPDIFGPVPEEQGSVAASVLTASLVTDYRGKESTG